ncbi:MAG: sugar phosphate isomerase/epimerase [Bacteroidetes bacterium]|nr:sugar phosphate isomerase/epimerase [Bacteroidota bacterium]
MKRRTFIRMGSGATAGILAAAAGSAWMNELLQDDEQARIKTFGLQLWTLREDFPKDPKGVLKKVADLGYKHVESFEGPKGMFWGMSNTEFKQYITDLGMNMYSSHFGGDDNFEKKVEDAAAIGMKYLTMAWEGPNKTIDDYKRYAEAFNKKGELCKKHGMRFAFHNHDYTFRMMEGQYGQDVLMNNTDASLVDFEMDIFWVVAAGQDPEVWFKKYPNRFRLCHIKDRSKTPDKEEGKNSVELGTGTINFAQVLKTARKNGMKHFIVEQEAYPNGTPLAAVKTDAEYMKKIRL